MPMVPGLSVTNMPSRINLEDEAPSQTLAEFYDPLFDDLLPLSITDQCELSEQIFDDGMYNSDSFPPPSVKRDCLFGKPEEQCLRECGQQCDPFGGNTGRHLSDDGGTLIPCYTLEDFIWACAPETLPQPYNPYNDHSYYQTIGYPESESKDTNCYESDSLSEDSADEIVDVETVQDKVEPPVSKVVKKRGRKPVKKFKFSNPKPVAMSNKRTAVMKRSSKMIQSGRVAKGRRRGKSSSEPSSASSSDAEENGKRSNHNNMERHRRDEQKRMLQGLRVLVPSIKGNPKTPKVMILTEAAKFIFQLKTQNSHNEQTMLTEREKNRKLLRLKRELENVSRS